MNRKVHVRFCEGLGVKFPGPTRPGGSWRKLEEHACKTPVENVPSYREAQEVGAYRVVP
jgi:hypothetical protein